MENNARGATFPVLATSFGVEVSVEQGMRVSGVRVATPEVADLVGITHIATCGGIRFVVSVSQYTVVVVSFQ